MTSNSYEIYNYSISKLKSIIADKSRVTINILNKKFITTYFENYFDYLGAKKIIAENNYIDRNFLDDFCGYYVRCFNQYKRECTRLHFFSNSFTEKDFELLLRGEDCSIDEQKLNSAYLGFVVIKPLPQTIIGRTCLKTYDDDNSRRTFPITRPYKANLFGIDLEVESLAFQEQDQVVSACATSALWSVFQESGKMFQHPIPSPVEITKIACDPLPLETRYLPNKGLTVSQMAHAIRSVNLEPYLIQAGNEEVLKTSVYAYLHVGIPILMVLAMVDISESGKKESLGNYIALHAVAIAGYSTGGKPATPYKNFLTKASRIDKFYAHDDQVGPFARMVFNKDKIKFAVNGGIAETTSLETSWKGADNKVGSVRAVPNILLIPVYHKIRITYETIEAKIVHFNEFIEILRSSDFLDLKTPIEWDIYLMTINEFKSNVFRSKELSAKLREEVLTESMPRFLWRASAIIKGRCILDLLFDATEIEQGLTLNRAIGYEETFFKTIVKVSQTKAIEAQFKKSHVWDILGWFSHVELKSP